MGDAFRTFLVLVALIICHISNADDPQKSFESLLKQEIEKKFSKARIEIVGPIRWVRGSLPAKIDALKLFGVDSQGNAHFSIGGIKTSVQESYSEGWVSFAAWTPAKIAKIRIRPGEPLNEENFVLQDINVASGQAYEYRGVILPRDTQLQSLEARQTILEGQFLVTTAVQRIPDVRRGDAIRVKIQSGDLILSAAGIAQEPGFLNQQIRVLASKNKKEVLGTLSRGGIVEVRL